MDRTQSYAPGIAVALLLFIDLVIVVISWYLPHDVSLVRAIMAGVQMVLLAITALATIRWVVRDY